MHPHRIETDYLIVGAGAMGMAFADALFSECPKARITLVDRRAKPGGHWNDAYPFVALHQPAVGYGVNSAQLGQGGADLSSRAEILFYYERVMKKLLASDRVQFLPMCDFQDKDTRSARIVSVLNGEPIAEINVRGKIVDASYMKVEVPATHKPQYSVDPDVTLTPPNALVQIKKPWKKYVVIGAGKTGIDAVLFLLEKGVEADQIQWIMSNDMWMWNRSRIQPGSVGTEFLRHGKAIADSEKLDDVFLRLEKEGSLFRVDKNVTPAKWRCATVSESEFHAVSKVKDLVRLGRVKQISCDEVRLEKGAAPASPDNLYIDCTANGLAARPPVPIFSPHRITLQSVMLCQQVFSAAVIAHLEAMKISDDDRNAMWRVVPHPEYVKHMPTCLITSLENLMRANLSMPFWLRKSRLNLTAHTPLYRYAKEGLSILRLLPEIQSATKKMQAA